MTERQEREKTKDELIQELDALRQRVAELEKAGARNTDLFEGSGESILLIDPLTLRIVYANANAARRLGYRREELLQLTSADLEAPDSTDRPSHEMAWESIVSNTVYYECRYRCKDGRDIPVQVSSRPVQHGRQEVLLNVVRDISARKEVERQLAEYRHHLEELVAARTAELAAAVAEAQRLNQELAQRLAVERDMLETLEQRVADRTRELSALYQIAAVANEGLPVDQTMARSLDVALATLGGQMGAIHLRPDDASPLRLAAQRGFSAEAAAQLEAASPGAGWWNGVLARDRPWLLFGDIPALLDAAGTTRLPALTAEMPACLAVPIRMQGQSVGVLSVLRTEGEPFTAEETALLTTIADQLGTAMASDRLRRQAEQARLLEERQRLARDLHDAVSQSLYSLALFANAARATGEAGQEERVHQYLERIEQTAHQALKEMRLLIYELRPAALAQGGLRDALERRLEAVERRSGIAFSFSAERFTAPVPSAVEDALYRIAQEALNNVLRHAQATAVAVGLATGDGWVELTVADNGVGFDPQAASASGGMGLSNIRQRVEELGGSLDITSQPGQGAQVRVRIATREMF